MNSKILGHIFVIIWLFILVLFTKWFVWDFTNLNYEKEQLTQTEQEKKQELEKLQAYEAKTSPEAEKYTKEIKEDEILDFIYSEIEAINKKIWWKVRIDSLSLTSAQKNELQFLESNINLVVTVPTEKKLKDILTFLTTTDEYKFFITRLTYEVGVSETGATDFQVTIPLKVFYK